MKIRNSELIPIKIAVPTCLMIIPLISAIFISNITSNPTIMTKMFTIPHLRDYKHTILLVHDENSIKFLKEENKATIYSISGGQVNNIQYISSKDELERFFK